MNPKKHLLLFGMAWALASSSLYSQDSSLAESLDQQIAILQSIEQTLTSNAKELESLRKQGQDLSETLALKESQIKIYEETTQTLLTSLTQQLNTLIARRETLLKNYDGLLNLSKSYQAKSETLGVLSLIEGGIIVVGGIIFFLSAKK